MAITDSQRAERINYLGGTDAAAVLGMSRWATPMSVWAEKTGLVPPKDLSGNRAVQRGIKLEPYVAEMFTEETGIVLEMVPETIYHPKHEFIAANLDRRVTGQNIPVELKTCGWRQKHEWANGGAPREYIIQVYHQMAVTGAKEAYLYCLVLGDDEPLKPLHIKRDDVAIANLIKREVEFWQRFIVKKVMPATVTALDKETLDAIYPEAKDEKAVPLGDKGAKIIEALGGYMADALHLEDEISQLQNELRAMIGDAELGTTQTHKVYWSNVRAMRFDREAFCKEHEALYNKFRKESVVRKFLIKEITNGRPE